MSLTATAHGQARSGSLLTASKKEVRKAAFIASVYSGIGGNRETEELIYQGMVLQLAKDHPDWTAHRLRYYVHTLRKRVDARRESTPMKFAKTWDEISNGILDAAGSIPGFGPGTTAIKRIHKQMLGSWYAEGRLGDAIQGALENGNTMDYGHEIGPKILAKTFDSKDPRVLQLWKEHLGADTNTMPSDSLDALAAKHGDVAVLLGLRALYKDNKGKNEALQVSLDKLEALLTAQGTAFAEMHKKTDSLIQAVAELDAKLGPVVAWQVEAHEQKLVQDRIDALNSEIENYAGAVALVTGLMSNGDAAAKRAARMISIAASAATQVATALVKNAAAVAMLANPATAPMGAMMLAGDLAKAAMTLLPLFTGEGADPQEVIMEQLTALRDDVHAMENRMHDRFDRVDAALRDIHKTLFTAFDALGARLRPTEEAIRSMRSDLTALTLAVTDFERNTQAALADVNRGRLRAALNGGLAARDRLPKLKRETFANEFENVFLTFAVDEAFLAFATGGPRSPAAYDEARLRDELSRPLDENVRYISEYVARNLGAPGFATQTAGGAPASPNPRDWALAAQAWGEVMLEWPEHARPFVPRSERILRVGRQLRDDLAAISQIVDGSGRPLILGVLSHYRDRLLSADGGALNVELNAWLQEAEAAWRSYRRVDAFGAEDQTPLDGPPLPERDVPTLGAPIAACTGGQEVAPPDNAGAIFPSREYLNARFLRLLHGEGELPATVRVCWENAQWVEEQPISCRFGDDDGCHDGESGLLEVTFITLYGERKLSTRTLTTTERYTITPRWSGDIPPTRRSAAGTVVADWPDLKALLARESGPATALADTHEELKAEIRRLLREEQAELYRYIAGRLTQAAGDDVPGRLSGRQWLLRHVLHLGLPRTLNSDEQIHALLHGSQAVPDQHGLSQIYLDAAAQPPAGNLRATLAALFKPRVDVLKSRIAGRGRETQPLLDQSLDIVEFVRDYYRGFVTLGGLRLSRSAFPVTRRGPSVRPAAGRNGTRVTYTLDAAARVRFDVQRETRGRRVGGRCVKLRRGASPKSKPCKRYVRVPGGFTRRRAAGRDRFVFTGRIRGRALARGRYRLLATPVIADGDAKTRRVSFRIV